MYRTRGLLRVDFAGYQYLRNQIGRKAAPQQLLKKPLPLHIGQAGRKPAPSKQPLERGGFIRLRQFFERLANQPAVEPARLKLPLSAEPTATLDTACRAHVRSGRATVIE